MTRPIRINVAGGWYHVFNRGQDRQRIFEGKRDYEHFLELVGEMHRQYRVRLYAYCLMGNHYHMLIGTPDANMSRAMQWLGDSYAMWRNRRYDRSGHVFAGRYGAILVEGQEWGLEVSAYVHLNPVVTIDVGLGKRRRKLEQKGWAGPPSPEQVSRRLEKIREYPWSSYRAYGGYEEGPKWLNTRVLLGRAGEEGEDGVSRTGGREAEARYGRESLAEGKMGSGAWERAICAKGAGKDPGASGQPWAGGVMSALGNRGTGGHDRAAEG